MSSTVEKKEGPLGTVWKWYALFIAILILTSSADALANIVIPENGIVDSDLPEELIVRDFSLLNDQFYSGTALVATVILYNDGSSAASYELPLNIDGEEAATISGDLRAGDVDTLTFSVQVNEPDRYEAQLPGTGESIPFEVLSGWSTPHFGGDNNPVAEYFEGPESTVLQTNWEYETGGGIQSAPVYANGTLFFGSNDDLIYAVDAESGNDRWTYPTDSSVRTSPVLVSGLVIAASQNGTIYAVDMESGTLNWEANAGATIWGSPTVEGELVYFGLRDIEEGDQNGVLVLEAETGSEVARFPAEGVIVNTPAVVDGLIFSGTSENLFYSVNTDRSEISVQQRFNWIFEGNLNFFNAPTVSGGTVFVAEDNLGNEAEFYAVDIETGEALWSRTFDPGRISSATVNEGVVYVGGHGGTFYALAADTGEELWSLSPQPDFGEISFGTASPILFDGKIVLHTTTPGGASNNDRVYILNQDDGEVLSVYDDLPNITTEPVMADGQLFLGTRSGQSWAMTSLRGSSADDFTPDPAESVITATTPHWAIESDPSEVTIELVNLEGEPLTGLVNDDFTILIDGNATAGEVAESFTDGQYLFELEGLSDGIVTVEVEVDGVRLISEAEIEFLDPESQWERVEIAELEPFHEISSIHFINEEEGWIAASPVDMPGEETLILATDDGGDSWVTIFQTGSFISDLFFTDSEYGWIVGLNGAVYATTDGGDTWEEQDPGIGSSLNSVFFTDREYGWIAGDNNFLLRTTDGGENWEASSPTEGVSITDVQFLDRNRGWYSQSSIPGIFRSNDGGENWTAQGDSLFFFGIDFADDQIGRAAGPGGLIALTDDGGNNWEPVNSEAGENLLALAFQDLERGWAVGQNRTLIQTEDGGESWSPVFADMPEIASLYDIQFINEDFGWAGGGQATILRFDVREDSPDPVVDATASSAEATTPHIADGEDASVLTIEVIDDEGEPITELTQDAFSIVSEGRIEVSSFMDSEDPGVYSFEVRSSNVSVAILFIRVLDVMLDDQPRIEFEEPEDEPVVDADASSLEATSPHLADGEDASEVTLTVLFDNGERVEGLTQEDIELIIDGPGEVTGFDLSDESGVYEFEVISDEAGEALITAEVLDVALNDTARIEFEEPEDDPVVDADASSLEATSPHLADGEDASEVTLTVLFDNGEPVEGLTQEDIELTIDGPGEVTGFESLSEPGIYQYRIVSDVNGTSELSAEVSGILLEEGAAIEFEEPDDGVVPVPQLTGIEESEAGPELFWNVDLSESISGFVIYRSSNVAGFEEIARTDADAGSFIDSDAITGSVFYSVAVLDRFGEVGERSQPLSFVQTTVAATEEWQLVSVPINGSGTASDRASLFAFTDRYEDRSELIGTEGYWIKTRTFDEEQFDLSGSGLDTVTVELEEGWNLIGSLSETIQLSSIDDPDGVLDNSPVYIYGDTGYEATEQLVSGSGHWVYADQEGEIYLSIFAEMEGADVESDDAVSGAMMVDDTHRLQFRSAGETRYLETAEAPLSHSERIASKLPPPAPDPSLDVRTEDHLRVIDYNETELELITENYPVEIHLTGEDDDVAYRVVAGRSGEERKIDISADSPGVIDREYDHIRIERIDASEVIAGHELKENYPNPFNPATTIRYQVGEQTHVQIEVFDSIGRRVQVLANEVQQAGEYRVTFDANHLASGVYMVRFQAGDVSETHRMTLIK